MSNVHELLRVARKRLADPQWRAAQPTDSTRRMCPSVYADRAVNAAAWEWPATDRIALRDAAKTLVTAELAKTDQDFETTIPQWIALFDAAIAAVAPPMEVR